jgi:hypothetical protein
MQPHKLDQPTSPNVLHAGVPPLEKVRPHGRGHAFMHVRAHKHLLQMADDKEGHADAGAEGAVAGVDERRGRRPAVRSGAEGARRHGATRRLAAWADAGEGRAVLEGVWCWIGRDQGEGIVADDADGEVAADGIDVDRALDAACRSAADGLVGGDLEDVHSGNASHHAHVFNISKSVDVGERSLRIYGGGTDRSQALFAP